MKYQVTNTILQQAVTSAERQVQRAYEALRGVGMDSATYAKEQRRLRAAVAKAYSEHSAAKRALYSAESTMYDSPESAAAAIADALGWPGFCLGGWSRAYDGLEECRVYASEAERDAGTHGGPTVYTVDGGKG